MPTDTGNLLIVVFGFAITFVAARVLGARWRARRRQRAVDAVRAGESRQVRRARERSQGR